MFIFDQNNSLYKLLLRVKLLLFYSLLFLICHTFIGCPPESWEKAQQAYQNGDYPTSVAYGVQSLKEKPDFEDAKKFLNNVIPLAYDNLYQKAKSADNIRDYDESFKTYNILKNLSDAVRSLPGNFLTKNVDAEIEEARKNAAESHYQNGLSFEKTSDYKEAAKSFTKAQEYIYGYKDAAERYERDRTIAIKRVAVMTFDNKSGKTEFGDLGGIITDQLISEVMSDPKNMEFMDFITRNKLGELFQEQDLGKSGALDEMTAIENGKVKGIHSFIFGSVLSVITNQIPESKLKIERTGKYYDYKTKKEYPIFATVIKTTRKANAKITCSYKIIDVATGKMLKSGTIPIEYKYEYEFGRVNRKRDVDENALTDEDKILCSKSEEYPPSSEELLNKAIEILSKSLANEIASYFR
jgi:hypothetical protein